ncbi:MAG TPA: hypothetical protein VNT51_00455, partial [Miltoncostaeaceae bacterium]|nr:hypothetical protein [Miltoncostaeaceae bacterium]
PYTVAALTRLWATAEGRAGLRRDAALPPAPRGGVWTAGLRWRGRPVRLLLHDRPARARAARRPGDGLRGNLLVRGRVPGSVHAALWALLGPAPGAR